MDALKGEVRRLEDRASGLERQLADKNRQLDDRERRRAARIEIARFLNEGEALKRGLQGPGDKAERMAQANAWGARVNTYLKALDSSYVSRFNAPSYQLDFSVEGVAPEVDGLWNAINRRTKELAKFLEELKD